jgi:hypothetical protein
VRKSSFGGLTHASNLIRGLADSEFPDPISKFGSKRQDQTGQALPDAAKETQSNAKRNSYILPSEIPTKKNHADNKNYRSSVGAQLSQSHSTISSSNFLGITNGPQDLKKKSRFSGAPSGFRFGEQKFEKARMQAGSGAQQINENTASSDSTPRSSKTDDGDPPNGHPDDHSNPRSNDSDLPGSKYSSDSEIESSDLNQIIDQYGR